MASKIIFLVAVLCAMQVVHAASVQKRDVISDLVSYINATLNQIPQQVATGMSLVQNMIQQAETQITTVVSSTTSSLQGTVTAIETQVNTVQGCATAQTASVQSLVNQAVSGIQTCAVTPIFNFYNAIQSLTNVGSQVTQLQQALQSALNPWNLLSLPSTIPILLNNATQLLTSLTTNLVEVSSTGPQQIAQIPTCADNIATAVGQQLSAILGNVQNCVAASG